MQDIKVCENTMKAFKIQSPCYRANGCNGAYYSIALTDDNGNVIKGFGDHISENSYGVRNVFKSEGTPFSDADRFITIKEVEVMEEEFDNWMASYNQADENRSNWFKAQDEITGGNSYNFLFTAPKSERENNKKVYDNWMAENPIPETPNYYGFLQLINEEN